VNDLLDRSFGSGSTTRITLKDPSATPRSDPLIPKTASPTSSPPLPPALDSQSSSSTSLATGCSPLQRRRSRLRLAFWRRTKSSPSSPPPPRFTYR
jgi:3',5'-cyclic-nucleotide phosphodiesterase